MGEYQFGGTLRNLQVKVELNYVGTSFGSLPSFSQFTERLTEKSQRAVDQSGGEVVNIKWQQKINQPSSNFESTHNENAESPPPSDPRQNRENDEEEAPRPLPRIRTSAQSRIFTYVDIDSYTKERKSISGSNANEESLSAFRPRKVAPLSTATIRHPVRENPTPEQHRKQRSFVLPHQKMFIMGYFGPWNEPYNVDDEKVLCEMSLFGQRVFHMKPDQGTYNIDTKIGNYRYTLSIEECVEFDEIPADDQVETPVMVEDQFKFQLPEKKTTYLQYLICIEEAINFPFDGLYIEYELDLPPNFKTNNKCSGRTQLCFTYPFEKDDIARFSFPFELDIVYKDNMTSEEPFRWPRLLFRVLAEDKWQRYYVAGYGSAALPTIPCAGQKIGVDCWRPINPYSSLCKLREQFIGQAVDLKGDESSKLALIDISKTFSKIGISSESSGTISLSISCMRQSRHYVQQEIMKTLRYGQFITQIGLNSNLYYRITRVLMQFEETKRQLIRLRKQHLPAVPRGSITS